MATLIFSLALLGGACGDGKTKLLVEEKAELTLQIASDLDHHDESPGTLAPLSFAVSPTEAVQLQRIVLVFDEVSFSSTHNESGGMEMGPDGFQKASADHEEHGEMMQLEDAGPFVVDLGLGLRTVGTFFVPPGTYAMVDLHLSPLTAGAAVDAPPGAEGLSVVLEGTYTNDATTVPLEVKLALSAEQDLAFQTMAAFDGHVLGAISVRTHGWFAYLDLQSAMVTTSAGSRIEISGSGALAQELFDRVADSFSFGLDMNGDGLVTDEEMLTEMPAH